MSLINEALKRAGEKSASVPSAAEMAAELRPADERQTGFPVLALLVLLIPLIALGAWFLVKGLQLNEPPQPAQTQAVVARAPEPQAAPAVIPSNAPPRPPLTAPAYKLQGIYWRPARPSAVINSKTVFVGDRVDKARVSAIDQDSVTLAVDGESKVLLLR